MSPPSHRDSLCLYADNSDKFINSQSEDGQDLAPDNTDHVSESQVEGSPEYMQFVSSAEEVFKLLPADMFPRKIVGRKQAKIFN